MQPRNLSTPQSPTISHPPRHYLDNAATSWPKPPAVYEAVMQQMQFCGAAAGRGAYHDAVTAANIVHQTRAAIARLISAPSAGCIVMAANGTAALNLAIQGIWPTAPTADHVVTTAAEHNSVLRPLQALADRGGIELQIVPCDAGGSVRAEDVLAAVRDDTRLVAVGHASNVTAAMQPIEAIGEALADHPAWLLCDAAQTFGYTPIDVQRSHIDLLAAPGHKGSLGPLGTGFLYVAPQAHERLAPSVWGGTGGNSDLLTMPAEMPDRLEAGNLNVPAIAGWLAGLLWLEQQTDRPQHLRALTVQLDQGLTNLPGIRCIGEGNALPLRSIVVAGLTPSDVGAILDAEFGVQVRTGLHCAALLHRSLGTQPDGTVRISAGHLTTDDDVAAAVDAVAKIAAELHA